ncbi:MAG: hypothetical protein LBH52_01545 [Puniceicoccales bacterium]|jgi:hypothetical protein|nr:hypothetical protein [Puniceicoccales bacterium]
MSVQNCISYLTNQLNPPIDSQQTKQCLATAEIFSQMVNAMFPLAAPEWPCASKAEALKTILFNCTTQHIPRLFILIEKINEYVQKSKPTHLKHALDEFQSATAHMIPMLELAQARVERMPLEVLNQAGLTIIAAAEIETHDQKHGITLEMRQRAGARPENQLSNKNL